MSGLPRLFLRNVLMPITDVRALLFPQRCPVCYASMGDSLGWACGNCWESLPAAGRGIWSDEPRLKSGALAVFHYGETARRIVHTMKFGGRPDVAERLGQEMARRFSEWFELTNYSAVVPVPLHPARVRERGFDQSLLMAQALAARLGLPMRTDLIVRMRHRPPQSRLSDEARRRNLREAYQPASRKTTPPPDGIALVIDDVIHTGATALGTLDALREAGVRQTFFLAACG